MDTEQTLEDFNKSQTIESKIHEACLKGETEKFLNLISEADHLDIQDIDQKRTLIQAVKSKSLKMVQKLLDQGANINIRCGKFRLTPLFIACRDGPDEIAIELIERGANVNLESLDVGKVPLICAFLKNRVKVIQKLLEFGANPNMDYNPLPPLQLACLYGFFEIAKLLMLHGAKITKEAFASATMHDNVEMVQYMLDLGADMRQYNDLASVSSKGHLDVLKLLIRYGADVNEIIYNCGTPLQNAVKKKHLKIVSELLKSGANANLQYQDGNTSIHVAAKLPDSMKVLLNEGGYIDLNIRNKHGQTALEITLENGFKDVTKMILLYMKSM